MWFEVLSLIGVLTCFVAARHTHTWSHQLYWIVGGIAALILAGSGWAVWVLIGARALRSRQLALMTVIDTVVAPEPESAAPVAGVLVSGRGMTHYHREGCLLLRGRSGAPAPLKAHLDAGRTPCGMCRPGVSAP